ncbi:MAG: PH domain-containing protein, partial [Acidimicrobiia bacterium]|nr:PH domain-containing protein [Acidimicrobiia bacterium]
MQGTLDRRIRRVWMVGAVVPILILVGGSAIAWLAGVPLLAGLLVAMALLVGATVLWWVDARWKSWWYEMTPTELIIRFGVLFKVERWLPRTRVQHVDIVSGPLERMLGLSQIVIYTAGTREADVTVPGLATATAEAMRAELLAWIRPETDGGTDGGTD